MNPLLIVLEDAPDPDSPNRVIRRARRVDPLRLLALTDREWAAAERLRADHDLAAGYREGAGEAVRVDRQGSADHYAAAQLDALRHMAVVASGAVMPLAAWDTVQYVVLHWQSLRGTDALLKVRKGTAEQRLRVGLAALSAYYG